MDYQLIQVAEGGEEVMMVMMMFINLYCAFLVERF